MQNLLRSLIFAIWPFLLSAHAQADEDLMLVNSSTGSSSSICLEDIQSLEQSVIETTNEFIDGKRAFTGPLMTELLSTYGAGDASHVRLIAANDYRVEIEVSEFSTYNVVLAHTVDDQPLSRRDKGPLWLIYPMSDYEELSDPVYNSRLIWQVVRIEYW